MMPRLLTLFPSHARGGAEEYALTIATAALQAGWQVAGAFPLTAGTETLVCDFRRAGIAYYPARIGEAPSLRVPGRRGDLLRLAATVRLLLKIRPDVVHMILPWPTLGLASILACALLRIPTVVVFQLAPTRFTLGPRRRHIYTWARSRRQVWVAVSEHNRKVVADAFQVSSDQLLTIYNGSRPAADREPSGEARRRERAGLLDELTLDDSACLILTVGRLSDQKGYDDLAWVVPDIVREFPEVRFLWVGEGESRPQLEKLVEGSNVRSRVLLLGQRADVPRLLQAADLFVFPSRFEGHPFALLEAMGHGLPVVAADSTSIPEIITDELDGLLFRAGDRLDLLRALRYALQHREVMRQFADRAIIRSATFTEERMVRTTLRLLENLTTVDGESR